MVDVVGGGGGTIRGWPGRAATSSASRRAIAASSASSWESVLSMSVDGPVAAPAAPYDRNTKRAPVTSAIWRNTASAWSSDSDEATGNTLMPRLTAAWVVAS